jgi:hypothetical protein
MANISFSGGAALEAKLREIAEKAGAPKAVRVGFLEGATYADGKPVAQIAAINEFGAPEANIPPRPFFRGMVERKKGEWAGDLGKIIVASDYDQDVSLGLMGKLIEDQLQESIREFSSPENAESTIEKKGFNKPLIDTSHMLNSVSSEIKAGDGS